MKNRILIVGGLVLLVLLLAGAAFLGGQLLNGQALPTLASSDGLGIFSSQGSESVHTTLDILSAQELPQTPADVKGVFDHRQDNSIFIGTGEVHLMVQPDQSGDVQTASSHDGPTVEVVVTPQTIVYRDTTMKQFGYHLTARGGTMQQIVELGSLDEIGENSMVIAWGKQTGNRIIADVLVYTPPPLPIKR